MYNCFRTIKIPSRINRHNENFFCIQILLPTPLLSGHEQGKNGLYTLYICMYNMQRKIKCYNR